MCVGWYATSVAVEMGRYSRSGISRFGENVRISRSVMSGFLVGDIFSRNGIGKIDGRFGFSGSGILRRGIIF